MPLQNILPSCDFWYQFKVLTYYILSHNRFINKSPRHVFSGTQKYIAQILNYFPLHACFVSEGGL